MPPKKLGPSQLLAGDGAGDGSVVVGGTAVVLFGLKVVVVPFGGSVVVDGLIVVVVTFGACVVGGAVVVVVAVVVVGIGVVVGLEVGGTTVVVLLSIVGTVVLMLLPDVVGFIGSGGKDTSGFSWWTSAASGDLTGVEVAADTHATARRTTTVVFNKTILSSVRW